MKTRQDNDMTNHTGVVYVENKTKLSCSIEPSAVYDENKTGQRRDQSIGLVCTKTKTELLGPI